MDTIRGILDHLRQHDVEFVIIGGMAGVVHGSSLVTEELDICAPFTVENLARLVGALQGCQPRHRMPPHQPQLSETPEQLAAFKNLNLTTDIGQLDVLSEVDALGSYHDVRRHCVAVEVEGRRVHVLDLESLIRAKEAMNRPRDRQAVIELKALLERQCREHGP